MTTPQRFTADSPDQFVVRDTEGSALVWAGRPVSVLFFEVEATAQRIADRYNSGWRPSR